MGRPMECAILIRDGLTPSQIANQFGISRASVNQYIHIAVGQGLIRRSDILFNLRNELETALQYIRENTETQTSQELTSNLIEQGLNIDNDDLIEYINLRESRVYLGDLYEFLSELECSLHEQIRNVLQGELGQDDDIWWRNGVPKQIRVQCVTSREEDEEPTQHPYFYTTITHLKDILSSRWSLFQRRLPPDIASDKTSLMSALDRLRTIRNRVMHPVRSVPPSEDDFDFIREWRDKLLASRWRLSNSSTSRDRP